VGYLHIDNLYKSQDILLFRECYALEKIHGTSAHISWQESTLDFFSGGEAHARFVALFDSVSLTEAFLRLRHSEVTVYGEAYGGKQQGMSAVYGKELRFVAFDVRIGETWISVPDMDTVARDLGLDVVDWRKITTDAEALNAERDRPSTQAARNGISGDQLREGIVLRPLIEVTKNNGGRIIAKHKQEAFAERATPQKIVDPAKLQVLADADAIAQEWVTEMRLSHVLDKLGAVGIEQTKSVIDAMVEDVLREASGEIVDSRSAQRAIGARAAKMFRARLQSKIGLI
jgi:hypothetical protein